MKKAALRAPARKRYSTIKIKATNFLTNISHRRNKKSDFNIGNFVIDVYSFQIKIIDNVLKCCGKNVYRNNLLNISFFMINFWL